MSTYQMPTKNPRTGKYQIATWWDDYFGEHHYGVQFPGEDKVYRADDRKWETKDTVEAFAYYSNAEIKEQKYNWFQKLIRYILRIK